MSEEHNIKPYESAHGRAKLVVGVLGAIMVTNVASTIMDYQQIQFAEKVQRGAEVSATEINTIDALVQRIGAVQISTYMIATVLFFLWIHRAHRNLPALGARGLKYTPASSVWWWFVPVLNLYRPYRAVGEIWDASGPEYEPGIDKAWRHPHGSVLVTFWWIGFAASGIAGRFAGIAYGRAETLEQVIAATRGLLFSDSFDVFVALLAILMVKSIDERQEARSLRLLRETGQPAGTTAQNIAA